MMPHQKRARGSQYLDNRDKHATRDGCGRPVNSGARNGKDGQNGQDGRPRRGIASLWLALFSLFHEKTEKLKTVY